MSANQQVTSGGYHHQEMLPTYSDKLNSTPSSFVYFSGARDVPALFKGHQQHDSNNYTNQIQQQFDGITHEPMFSNNRKSIDDSPVSVLPNLKEFLQETYSSYPSHREVNQISHSNQHVHAQLTHQPTFQQPQQTYYRNYTDDNISSHPNRKYETNIYQTPRSPNGCSLTSQYVTSPPRTSFSSIPDNQGLSQLYDRISQLERQLEKQSNMISDLERENGSLRVQINESEQRLHSNASMNYSLKSSPPNPEPIKTRISTRSNITSSKKRRESPLECNNASPLSNGSSYEKPAKILKPNNVKHTVTSSFSIVDESDRDHTKSHKPVGDLDDYSVKWKGKTYVLIDAFKNRTQILNYFVPLFQNKFPEKSCKLVLCNDDYKSLFKENYNRSNSEKKHAWRVSIFTIEFYNFVKSQQVDN